MSYESLSTTETRAITGAGEALVCTTRVATKAERTEKVVASCMVKRGVRVNWLSPLLTYAFILPC